MQAAEIFIAVIEMMGRLGVERINKLPGCWEHQVNDEWAVSINGHPTLTKDSTGGEIPPLHIAAHYRGWPAGMIGMGGGIIAHGKEDEFIAAVQAVRGAL